MGISSSSFALENLDTALYKHAAAYTGSDKSLEQLTEYLIRPTKTEQEKAEVFLYWISQNISYSGSDYLKRDEKGLVIDLLKVKRGVCADYSTLYKSMCNLVGIECHIVAGYIKWPGEIRTEYGSPDHAWNVVKLNGAYTYVDPTWASGHVLESNGRERYVKELDLAYAFNLENQIRSDHLTADPRWQLLAQPISLASFLKHDDFEEMRNRTSSKYIFVDSISTYLSASKAEQQVLEFSATYKFNPSKDNLKLLGDAYYNAGYFTINEKGPSARLSRALKYFQDSIKIYERTASNLPEIKTRIAGSKEGVAYCEHYLSRP